MYRIERGSPQYPLRLQTLEDPPEALWVVGGDFDRPAGLRFDLAKSVAMVGARASTAYGEQVAYTMAEHLAVQDITVVSGGAYGIDRASHQGAVDAGGRTVVVLAGGVDVAYPRQHEQLFRRVVERGGYLVSEYPPGTPPRRDQFLRRNSLIAALSQVMVVVEASTRSGSLHAASRARALGRRVVAVPGPVTSVSSEGTNHLIRTGAGLVTSAADVMAEMDGWGVTTW